VTTLDAGPATNAPIDPTRSKCTNVSMMIFIDRPYSTRDGAVAREASVSSTRIKFHPGTICLAYGYRLVILTRDAQGRDHVLLKWCRSAV